MGGVLRLRRIFERKQNIISYGFLNQVMLYAERGNTTFSGFKFKDYDKFEPRHDRLPFRSFLDKIAWICDGTFVSEQSKEAVRMEAKFWEEEFSRFLKLGYKPRTYIEQIKIDIAKDKTKQQKLDKGSI